MRTAACAMVLLCILFQGEALKCNFCFSSSSDLCVPTSVQTCSLTQNACGAVILQGPFNRSFRQCMNMAVCQGFITTPGALASCCSTDLCN
uniref:UPAR/Ly6 domain-containing protein n=1 Tax=Nothobranchius furzeri TaxID=105023 RepID=A0A8C6LNV9_NOTFU